MPTDPDNPYPYKGNDPASVEHVITYLWDNYVISYQAAIALANEEYNEIKADETAGLSARVSAEKLAVKHDLTAVKLNEEEDDVADALDLVPDSGEKDDEDD